MLDKENASCEKVLLGGRPGVLPPIERGIFVAATASADSRDLTNKNLLRSGPESSNLGPREDQPGVSTVSRLGGSAK